MPFYSPGEETITFGCRPDGELEQYLEKNPNEDINQQYHTSQMTELHIAAEKGKIRDVKAILAHPNVNPNLRDREGYTALHTAVHLGLEDIVLVLAADKRTTVLTRCYGGDYELEKDQDNVLDTALDPPLGANARVPLALLAGKADEICRLARGDPRYSSLWEITGLSPSDNVKDLPEDVAEGIARKALEMYHKSQ
jgi:hypothetical protein